VCDSSTYGVHCPPDEYKANGTSCGNCGQCSNGACTNQGECEPGSTRSCGSCGTQTCLDNCTWGSCENDKGGEGAPCETGDDCCSGVCYENICVSPSGFNPSEGDIVAVGGIDGEEGNFIITSDFALGSGEVAGTETGTIYIKEGATLTLNEDSTLIWGKGGAVKLLDNAKIIFISSASGSGTLVRAGEKILAAGDSHINRRACICVKDQDGDGYWVTSSAKLVIDTSPGDCDNPADPVECDSGYVSLNSSNLKGRGDCDDTSNLRWQEVTGYTPDNDGDYYAPGLGSGGSLVTACCGEGNWDGGDTSTWYKHCNPTIAPWVGDCDDSVSGYGPGAYQMQTQSCQYYNEGVQGTQTCMMVYQPGALFSNSNHCEAYVHIIWNFNPPTQPCSSYPCTIYTAVGDLQYAVTFDEPCDHPPCDVTISGNYYHCAYAISYYEEGVGNYWKCYYCSDNECICNSDPTDSSDLCGMKQWSTCVPEGQTPSPGGPGGHGLGNCDNVCELDQTQECTIEEGGWQTGIQSRYRQCNPNGKGSWGNWSDWSSCGPYEYQQH